LSNCTPVSLHKLKCSCAHTLSCLLCTVLLTVLGIIIIIIIIIITTTCKNKRNTDGSIYYCLGTLNITISLLLILPLRAHRAAIQFTCLISVGVMQHINSSKTFTVYMRVNNQRKSAPKILHLIVNEYFIRHNLPLSHPYNFINTTTHVNTTNEG